MIPLTIDRDQIKDDIDALRMPLLILLGGILGTILGVAQIVYDHIVLDVFRWGSITVFASFMLYKLYDRYTVSEEAENPTKGDRG